MPNYVAAPAHTVLLDEYLQEERAWLRLTVLRFFGSPRLPAMWPAYLVGLYHSMHAAITLMETALVRSRALADECPVAARLVCYWEQHIPEETGHDAWLVADMRRLGIDTERALAAPPPPEVAELLGTLHFWVLHTHPVAALAYFHIVERDPPSVALLDWLADSASIPRDTLATFYRHAVIDLAHGRELQELLDGLPLTAEHRELLAVSARTLLRQLARILERLLERPSSVPMV